MEKMPRSSNGRPASKFIILGVFIVVIGSAFYLWNLSSTNAQLRSHISSELQLRGRESQRLEAVTSHLKLCEDENGRNKQMMLSKESEMQKIKEVAKNEKEKILLDNKVQMKECEDNKNQVESDIHQTQQEKKDIEEKLTTCTSEKETLTASQTEKQTEQQKALKDEKNKMVNLILSVLGPEQLHKLVAAGMDVPPEIRHHLQNDKPQETQNQKQSDAPNHVIPKHPAGDQNAVQSEQKPQGGAEQTDLKVAAAQNAQQASNQGQGVKTHGQGETPQGQGEQPKKPVDNPKGQGETPQGQGEQPKGLAEQPKGQHETPQGQGGHLINIPHPLSNSLVKEQEQRKDVERQRNEAQERALHDKLNGAVHRDDEKEGDNLKEPPKPDGDEDEDNNNDAGERNDSKKKMMSKLRSNIRRQREKRAK